MSQLCFISSNVVQYSPNSTTSVFSHSCQPDLGKITLIDSSDAISACLTTPSHCAKVNMGVKIFFFHLVILEPSFSFCVHYVN